MTVRRPPFPFVLAALVLSAASARAQPDLFVDDLRLDAQNRLLVRFGNVGDETVPAGVGGLSITIDGRAVGGYSLALLADQSFRDPGGSVTIPTNFRLAGDFRRVVAVVDPNGEIDESIEVHNARARSLRPAVLAGPDLVCGPLGLDVSRRLVFRVYNEGDRPTPTPFSVRVRILVPGRPPRDLVRDLGGIAPGGFRWVVPEAPAIVVDAPAKVRVLLNAPTFLSEIDDTNNVREAWLPEPPLLGELDALLALPQIRDLLVWREDGARAYGAWTAGERAALRAAFVRLENGERPGLARPPVLTAERLIPRADAWSMYVSHVAHSLWVEASGRVPWSLLDLPAWQRSLLLDSRWVVADIPGVTDFTYNYDRHGLLTDWDPQISRQFLDSLRLVRGTPEATLYAIGDWMRAHLRHLAGDDDWNEIYAYDAQPPVDRIVYPVDGQIHWTGGCQVTAPLFRALLRAVNVPAAINEPATLWGHRRPIFPSLDRTLAHADDIHSGFLQPGAGRELPIEAVFVDFDTMEERYLSPPLDCNPWPRCHTPEMQWSYNSEHDELEDAIFYRADSMLEEYAFWGVDGFVEMLTGDLTRFVRPLFTPGQINLARIRVEAELRLLGGGDLELGREIVLERSERFGRGVNAF